MLVPLKLAARGMDISLQMEMDWDSMTLIAIQ